MATENVVMAAVLAEGETVIGNAACEPHVQDLCRFLVSLGAQIEGIGSNVLRIQGVEQPVGRRVARRAGAHRGRQLHRPRRGDRRRPDDRGRRAARPDLDPAGVRAARRPGRGRGDDGARSARPGARDPGRPRRADPEDRGRPLARVPGRPDVDRRRHARRRRTARCSSSRRCSRAGCSSSTSSSRWARGSSSAIRTARS